MRIPLDVVGDIAILKFPRNSYRIYKKFYAWRLLRKNKNIKVVLEKVGKVSGRLRIHKTNFLAGEKRKETTHKENDCLFFFNVDKTYFSPRLSFERKSVAEDILLEVRKRKIDGPKILVMFAGVAPLPIIVGKTLKKAGIKAKIISSELNKMASAFAKKNVLMNKIEDYVSIFSGDSRKLCFDFAKKKENFDFILMPRPNLKESFLVEAMKVAKRGTIFYYHGFGDEKKVRKEILESIHKTDKKISELEFRKAGDIGVRQNRWSVKFSVR